MIQVGGGLPKRKINAEMKDLQTSGVPHKSIKYNV